MLLRRTREGVLRWFPWHDRGTFSATFDNRTGVVIAQGPRGLHNRDEGDVDTNRQRWTDLSLLNEDGLEVARYSAAPDWSPFVAASVSPEAGESLTELFPLAGRSALGTETVVEAMLAQLAG